MVQLKSAMASLLVQVVVLVLSAATGCHCVEICEKYPSPDPCLPGGVWDPVLMSCTGYDERPCYNCYSGPFCKTKEDILSCNLPAYGGNPVYLSEYWLNNTSDPCTSTLGHYRPAYQRGSASSHSILAPLTAAIYKIHSMTDNAETEGYHLVTGIGATMVINTAIAALSRKMLANCTQDCPSKVDVFAQTPYYPAYPELNELQSATARWNATADPTSPWTIEILTYPNNPNGMKRAPLVQNPDHVIMDMVYYWPMYTDIDMRMEQPIMIFSSSKHDGLAGTRFGWGLVKDQDLADSMWDIASSMVLSPSVDIELRVLTSLQTILSEVQNPTQMLPFHKFGRDIIFGRFEKLRIALKGCPHLELQNPIVSPGAYAWVHCHGNDPCVKVFNTVNLFGFSGIYYGTTDNDIRFSMVLPSVEFDILHEKVKALCS